MFCQFAKLNYRNLVSGLQYFHGSKIVFWLAYFSSVSDSQILVSFSIFTSEVKIQLSN